MMNEYYANEPMDQLNKGLFTFAAYNAGPGRIRGLRKLAAQRAERERAKEVAKESK